MQLKTVPNAGGLTDREAAIDALIRFVDGLDEGDTDLLASSLTETANMHLEFGNTGMRPRTIIGRDAVVRMLMARIGLPLDTTHMATNIRCYVDGDKAQLTAAILAQHFRKGEGESPATQDYYLNGNKYRCVVVRSDGGVWKMESITLAPAWTMGKPEVMDV